MSGRWLFAAFLLACVVPLAECLVPGLILARGSQTALALLPWLALAPLPRSQPAQETPWRATARIGCFVLPPLLLGLGLDLARGAAPRPLGLAAGTAGLVLGLWVGAAEVAARSARGRALFGALWLTLLPGFAALRLALGWAPRSSAAGPEAAGWRWSSLDPLVWCHGWGRPGALAALEGAELLVPVLTALLVLGFVSSLERRPTGSSP